MGLRSSGTNAAGTRQTSGALKQGSLKRRLPSATVGDMNSSGLVGFDTGTFTFRLVLKNLNRDLAIDISVGVPTNDGSNPIDPSDVPAGAVRYQITPVKIQGDVPPTPLRQVFQDPTATDNANHPLPQDAPFGWDFKTNADDLWIDVTINAALFVSTEFNGTIVVQATVEYESGWNYPEAALYALNQVQLMNTSQPVILNTSTPA